MRPIQDQEEVNKTLVKRFIAFNLRFQVNTKCIDPLQAKSYVEMHDYNIESAIKTSDINWESKNRSSSSTSKGKLHARN
jgi:hypothetical protein